MPEITITARIQKLGICKQPGHEGFLRDPAARKEWFTLTELALLKLPGVPRTTAAMEDYCFLHCWWASHHVSGGLVRPREQDIEFHISLLPEDAQVTLRAIQSVVTL